jgi:tricorn protease interacting factor F2/3
VPVQGAPTREVSEYRLSLDINIEQLRFHGSLELQLKGEGDALWLQALGLRCVAVRAGDAVVACTPDAEHEGWRLEPIPAAAQRVHVDYEGDINLDSLTGLYRSRFGGGFLYTTDLSPTNARRLLPCVDRPNAKAVFVLTVRTDPSLEVVSNMEAEDFRMVDGRRETRFAPTPPMSTYLLYLGLGGFEELRSQADGGRTRLLAPPGRAAEGRFAVDLAERLLTHYESYYGLPYPLPKLHLVSVPEFNWGAMENWGAITFRETLLLVDPAATTERRRRVAAGVAHELAHQWFGNLVTMSDWNDLWLNESFATFVGHKTDDALHTGADIWSDFLVLQTTPALLGDSLGSTHPVRVRAHGVNEVAQIFDEISYGKGASVLRMLEGYLGDSTFRRGVKAYLEKFRYGNARAEDLWEALGEAAGAPVSQWMSEWIDRPGHPLLTVEVRDGKLRVEQRRFALTGDHRDESWPVPLVMRRDGVVSRHLLVDRLTELPDAPQHQLNINVEALAFCRVLYRGEAARLHRAAFPGESDRERWARYRDALAFLLSGDLVPQEYLDLLGAAGTETAFVVLRELVQQVAVLKGVLYDRPPFEAAAVQFLRAQTDRFGQRAKEGEPPNFGSLRSGLHALRVRLDPPFARALAADYARLSECDADLRPSIRRAFALANGASAMEALTAEAGATGRDAVRLEIESALVSIPDPNVVTRTLDRALEGDINRAHLGLLLDSALANTHIRSDLWEWYVTRWDRLVLLHAGSSLMGTILEHGVPLLGIGRGAEVRAFLEPRVPADASRGLAKGLEWLTLFERLRGRGLQG